MTQSSTSMDHVARSEVEAVPHRSPEAERQHDPGAGYYHAIGTNRRRRADAKAGKSIVEARGADDELQFTGVKLP